MRGKAQVRFSIGIPKDLNHALEKICVMRRGVTKTQIIQAALTEFLFPEGEDKKDAEMERHLRRMERRIKSIERGNEILGETLSVFIRMWLTNTLEVPESQKEIAERQGGKRYGNFLKALSVRLQSGRCLFSDLPEDVFEEGTAEEFFRDPDALVEAIEV